MNIQKTIGNLQIIKGGGFRKIYYTAYEVNPFKVILRTTDAEKVRKLIEERSK